MKIKRANTLPDDERRKKAENIMMQLMKSCEGLDDDEDEIG